MIRAAIDTTALLKLFYSSLLAGVGVAIVFSVAILGVTRSSDMRRENRTGAATIYAVIAAVGLLVAMAIVVYGLILVARK